MVIPVIAVTKALNPAGRERMGNATVEGLGTLPSALKLTRSLELEEKELPLLYHLDAVLQGERAASDPDLARLLAE